VLLSRSLYNVIINTNVPTMLDDETLQMSMFAPIDFSPMRKTNLGIKLLDDRFYARRLRNVRRSLITLVFLHLYAMLL